MTKWGIMGCGGISASFAADLALVAGAERYAAAARDGDRAATWATEHGFSKGCSYDALLADEAVEVVYIGVIHPQHHKLAKRALAAGKHVLCEKPLCLNAAQVSELIACAKEHDRFLMEAVWTRFFPVWQEIRNWIDAGRIGRIISMRGDFSVALPADPNHRGHDITQGGGALLDLGIYPIQVANWLLAGEPVAHSSTVVLRHGVDATESVCLRYPDDCLVSFTASTVAEGNHSLEIFGESGSIRIPGAWWPRSATLVCSWAEAGTAEETFEGKGYRFEAAHVQDCLTTGQRESPIMPLADSLRCARIMDRLRADWGLRYPDE